MSAILRWWTRYDPTAAPRVLGALLVVGVLVVTGLGALAARPASSAKPVWAAAPSPSAPHRDPHPGQPPPGLPQPGQPRSGKPPARVAPAPRGAAPLPSPPAWLMDPAGDFVGWAILEYGDHGTSTLAHSHNATEVSTTASMIKAWIAADYLRRATETGRAPSVTRLAELTEVIRDSDNAHTQTIFTELGAHESIERLIDICELPYARAYPNRWSNTQLSPVDTALMGVCIADGRAAGPEWTQWLLDEMRLVRGVGDFGIRHALPPEQRAAIAIKNGWVVRASQGAWHVNCLAIGDSWTMGVMTRYPAELGYEYGAEVCRSLAAAHLPATPLADQGDSQPDMPESGLNDS